MKPFTSNESQLKIYINYIVLITKINIKTKTFISDLPQISEETINGAKISDYSILRYKNKINELENELMIITKEFKNKYSNYINELNQQLSLIKTEFKYFKKEENTKIEPSKLIKNTKEIKNNKDNDSKENEDEENEDEENEDEENEDEENKDEENKDEENKDEEVFLRNFESSKIYYQIKEEVDQYIIIDNESSKIKNIRKLSYLFISCTLILGSYSIFKKIKYNNSIFSTYTISFIGSFLFVLFCLNYYLILNKTKQIENLKKQNEAFSSLCSSLDQLKKL
jgi:hypothetical protein